MKPVGTLTVASFLVICQVIPLSARDLSDAIREGDQLWEGRADPAKAQASIDAYMKALKVNPDHYEASWKVARSCFYLGDSLPETDALKERHRALGEKGMEYATRAIEAQPQGIEGHYYYALSLAEYSIGISIVKALLKGLAPDYQSHLEKVLSINRAYDYGGPLRALGRYWYRLPWPKRDLKKSIAYLEEARAIAPFSVRGHVYLAESYLKKGEKEAAREALDKALTSASQGLEVDAERWQQRARELLDEHF